MYEGQDIVHEEIVPARTGWARRIEHGETLVITDLEGRQAVDFLCFDADAPQDRYSATNTVKVQGNIYVGFGTVLYADSGKALMRVVEDTVGRHDTIMAAAAMPTTACATASRRHSPAIRISRACWRR